MLITLPLLHSSGLELDRPDKVYEQTQYHIKHTAKQ